MKIAIMVAMPEEFSAVARCLENGINRQVAGLKARTGCFERHKILLVESGMGFDNARRATETVIRDEAPDLLISTGFCGGIAPELLVGDLVVAKKIVLVSETGIKELPTGIPAAGLNLVDLQTACGIRVFSGTFASTAVITSKAKLAGMLSDAHHCPVVEMESAAIALVAAENRIPLLAIRSVSDPADEELGFSLDEFCDSSLRIRPSRVLGTILRKPRIIPQLIRLAGNSRIAAGSLTTAIKQLLPLL